MLKACSQKYYHYKIAATPVDPDFEQDSSVFNIGTTFHYVLEMTKHVYPHPDFARLLESKCLELKLDKDDMAMIHGMLLKYHKLHQETGLTCIYAELELSSDEFYGLVDVVLVNQVTGDWWLADLKTAARLNNFVLARLHQDLQLNLYASFCNLIADYLELDIAKFKGCRYRVTTKPTIKRKSTETYLEFVVRNYTSAKTYDVPIPIEKMNPKQARESHAQLWHLANDLRSGKVLPEKNFAACDGYFKPCSYWSQCMSATHTECAKMVEEEMLKRE